MLRKMIFGASSEKHKPTAVDSNQLNMFAELDDQQESIEQLRKSKDTRKQKKHTQAVSHFQIIYP